jgi:hypothetical protein
VRRSWILLVILALVSPLAACTPLPRPKRLASGLMSVGNTDEWPNIIDVWVPNVEWRDIQPERDRFRFAQIDEMIARARASGDSLRLRLLAGRYAPGWVKRRFGTVVVQHPTDEITAVVPRWWVPGYMDVYERLQSRLAARYDRNVTVRSVTVSGAMTVWAEPFIRGISSALTRSNLRRAGYTPAKDRRAILASIDAQKPWERTRQVLAVNPWQFVRSDGYFGFDVGFTNYAMDRFRGTFGDRAILQNNSIRASWIGNMPARYGAMYRHMRALGRPISFQTARLDRAGDLRPVLAWCLAQGAHGVELPRGAADLLTAAEASSYDVTLEQNAEHPAHSAR